MKAITASIGFPLASLARKNDPKSYQNAEKALADYCYEYPQVLRKTLLEP
jgi:hypothetical protein